MQQSVDKYCLIIGNIQGIVLLPEKTELLRMHQQKWMEKGGDLPFETALFVFGTLFSGTEKHWVQNVTIGSGINES